MSFFVPKCVLQHSNSVHHTSVHNVTCAEVYIVPLMQQNAFTPNPMTREALPLDPLGYLKPCLG